MQEQRSHDHDTAERTQQSTASSPAQAAHTATAPVSSLPAPWERGAPASGRSDVHSCRGGCEARPSVATSPPGHGRAEFRLSASGPEARHVTAGTNGDRQVLVPREVPVRGHGLVEEQSSHHKRPRPQDRCDDFRQLLRGAAAGEPRESAGAGRERRKPHRHGLEHALAIGRGARSCDFDQIRDLVGRRTHRG